MKQYIADAFTTELFHGNPAAVCVLDAWIPDPLMRQIAAENGLPETAFTVPCGARYQLRWFTPAGEIDLCGHATLATAFILFTRYETTGDTLYFDTQSGELRAARHEGRYELDFPAYPLTPVPVTNAMEAAFGARPREAYLSRDLLAVFDSEETVRTMTPDPQKLKLLDGLSIAVTAPGSVYDCVSRVFTPELDTLEDPVTGSTHCMIAPYWQKRLQKDEIRAFQASKRTGILTCRCEGGRVKLSGNAVLYAVSDILPGYQP